MLLRRIISHFRKQEWTAIAIDFLIVVVGVFVAMQVTNWNDTRGDRAREGVYLFGLVEDLRADMADIDEINRVSGLRMSAMGFLIERASGAALPDGFDSGRGRILIEEVPEYEEDNPNSIAIAMFIHTPFDGTRLTYNTLTNTGDIAILRDPALVRAVQTYYANVDKVIHFEVSLEENRAQLVKAQQQVGLSAVDDISVPALATLFSGEPQLLANARNYWLYTNRHLKLMRDLRREADALSGLIEHGATP